MRKLDETLALSIMSNGLSYLYVPVKGCLENIHICVPDLERRIEKFGARFIYFFDPETLECRTWDNTGLYEDVATGSAAGPLISYLVQNGCREKNTTITLSQGRFLNRPSKISGSVNEAGMFKQGGVAVLAGTDLIHIAPPADRVLSLVQNLLTWLQASEDHRQ